MHEPERVAVLGLGDFGYHLACELYQLRHEVLAERVESGSTWDFLIVLCQEGGLRGAPVRPGTKSTVVRTDRCF